MCPVCTGGSVPPDERRSDMALPEIVSRDEWLVASKELLVKEKWLARARDAVNADRRRLPMVEIDEPYRFEGPGGLFTLLDLFEGRRQLIVEHVMFDPSWDDVCRSCAGRRDNVGRLEHLHARMEPLAMSPQRI